MRSSLLLLLLLFFYLTTTVLSTPLSAPPTTGDTTPPITPRSPPKCPTMHLPTLSQYTSAAKTFCTRHFLPSHTLIPNTPLAFTYGLTDPRGYPIRWVLSVTWEQGGFLGGGKTIVDRERCEAWFQASDEWLCEAEGGEILVKGGRRNAVGGEKGMRVWVEARRRKDDKFEPPKN